MKPAAVAASAAIHLALLGTLWWAWPSALPRSLPVHLIVRSTGAVPKGMMTVSKEIETSPQKTGGFSAGTVPPPEGIGAVPVGTDPIPQGMESVPQETTSVPLERTSIPEERTPVPEPQLISFETPAYPNRLRAAGVEGVVEVGVEVDEAGRAARVWVALTSGQPEFDRRALSAIQNARFVPATEGGRTVVSQTTCTVRFRLTS